MDLGKLYNEMLTKSLLNPLTVEQGKPDMSKKTHICPVCITTDEHLFLGDDAEWVCGKCYEKKYGIEV